MIFDKDRFKGVSVRTKIIMLEAENDAMQAMLSDAIDSLATIDSEIQSLRHALYLEIDDTE